LLQFFVKWGWRRIEVISVDHPLDRLVPFRPDLVGIYLDFVSFWIRSLGLLFKVLGVKRALPHVRRFLEYLRLAYREAARMYRFRMSTTVRPPCDDPTIRMMRRYDPHYLCVPSLHIAIVALTFSFHRHVFQIEDAGLDEQSSAHYRNEVYRGAVSIAEAVLYVKQHSVNCIPAALYMVCRIAPDFFTIPLAVDFINDLFVDTPDVPKESAERIRYHIGLLFEKLLLAGSFEDDWTVPVRNWILSYQSGHID
jgi:hypothetical protein